MQGKTVGWVPMFAALFAAKVGTRTEDTALRAIV